MSVWLSARIRKKRFVFNCMKLFYFKEELTTPLHRKSKTTKRHASVKNFWKQKKMGKIYKMWNAWLGNCISILDFKWNKRYKERDRKENAWRTVEQFWIVFLSQIRDQAILRKPVHFFITFAKKFIIQVTWNAILNHWHASPGIIYGEILVLLFKNVSCTHNFFLFPLLCFWWNKNLTARIL